MKHEFSKTAAALRLLFAVAALSATLSLGGFIDFLATSYSTVAEGKSRIVLTAGRKVD